MESTIVTYSKYPAHWLQKEPAQIEARPGLTNNASDDAPLLIEQRLAWFASDQRHLLAAGLATTTYLIRPHLVAHDEARQVATFECVGRDCLGNELTLYASATGEDCLEAASLKAISLVLAAFGYGSHSLPREAAPAQAAPHPGSGPVRTSLAHPTHDLEEAEITSSPAPAGVETSREQGGHLASPAEQKGGEHREASPAVPAAARPLSSAPGSVTKEQWAELAAQHQRANGTMPDSKLQQTLSETAAATWIERLKGKPDYVRQG